MELFFFIHEFYLNYNKKNNLINLKKIYSNV